MSITTEDIQKLASLARINLSEDEIGAFAKEIDSILGYVDQLNTVSAQMGNMAGNMQGTPSIPMHRNQMREDIADQNLSPNPLELVEAAPGHQAGQVKVKKILNQ
jgi:aspartyl-tRNA(Asn)/glutamyl-tRNA(Gln) amidotransferase subunit C